MKKYQNVFCILIIILFSVFLISKLKSTRDRLSEQAEEIIMVYDANAKMGSQLSIMSDFLFRQMSTNYVKLNEGILLYDASGREVALGEIVKDEMKFILRISEYDCNTCIEPFLNMLYQISAIIGAENVLILTSFKYDESFKEYCRNVKKGIKVYNYSHGNLGLQLEGTVKPFFFVLNKESVTQNSYIPIMDMIDDKVSKAYLKNLERVFNKVEF